MTVRLKDWIRTANRRRIERLRLAAPAVETPLGFRFSGIRQMIGAEWEAEERALVQLLLPQCNLFLNVGAHYGFYSCIALQMGIPAVAVEPIPANCAMIAKHVQANGWGKGFTLLPVAAGDIGGFIEIQGGGSGGTVVKGLSMAPASQVQTVPVVRLEDVVALRGRRMLVLMDVEGFELAALRGAAALLAASPRPIWIIEVQSHFGTMAAPRPNPAYAATFEFMQAAGYHAFRIDRGLAPLAAADAADRRQDRSTEAATNFLFLDRLLTPASLGLGTPG